MMRRVASRPRIVSWDNFDATTPSWSVDSSDTSSDYGSCIEDDLSMKRKRSTSLLDLVFAAVVAVEETASTPTETPPCVETLSDDVVLSILAFLTVPELRIVSYVNHGLREVVNNADCLWKEHLRKLWPHLPEDRAMTDQMLLHSRNGRPNYSYLLTLATSAPSTIDESILTPLRFSRTIRSRTVRASLATELVVDHEKTTVLRFVGTVGQGDRCGRSDHPLPRARKLPTRLLPRLPLLCRTPSLRLKSTGLYEPFVSPILREDGKIDLTPRLVAYFEIAIERLQVSTGECVAVGIATSGFRLHARMPGWDTHSYGYHSDDGGIFHASGSMVRKYGPTFSEGNCTVGCGLDYTTRCLFFTLNGVYLGTAFEDMNLEQDWFPVIGMDTKANVTCNFTGPFEFNLGTMLETQKHKVLEGLL